jgi:ribosomal protein L7/L12
MDDKQKEIKEKALDLLHKGKVVEATKLIVDEVGCTLFEAKKLVDELRKEMKK